MNGYLPTALLPVLSVTEVKALEQAWASDHGGTTWPLMQRAGAALAHRLRDLWPDARHIRVLCGPGNNGGDGYVAATLLAQAGLQVTVLAPLGLPKPGTDAQRAFSDYTRAGGSVCETPPDGNADALIDALLGTGHRGALNGALQSLIQALQQRCRVTLSADLPSGLDATTGQPSPGAIRADHTLTFIAYKPGLLTAAGPDSCGVLRLEPLDIPMCPADQAGGRYQRDPAPWPERPADGHKGRFGSVRVVAGADAMGGAGLLAAQAALHSGAGRVFWHTLPLQRGAALVAQPELMTADLDEALGDPQPCYVVGPGLGQGSTALRHYETLVEGGFKGVLDADGLTWLASQAVKLPGWVLTPHPGEAARLLNTTVDAIQADRYAAAEAIQKAYGATVVLKGAGTIVADDNSWTVVHPGTPAMATPGMGDCLAGMIAALMAQGYTPTQAAIAGADRHARLAYRLARQQRVVLASDVISLLRSNT
ncbi:MAG: NAD(P)H-hydrate dehydratase [Saccharospirillum sp.]